MRVVRLAMPEAVCSHEGVFLKPSFSPRLLPVSLPLVLLLTNHSLAEVVLGAVLAGWVRLCFQKHLIALESLYFA